jgi:hypothetical protein
MAMNGEERLVTLKELAAGLEKLPRSRVRDALLAQVRARDVILETGLLSLGLAKRGEREVVPQRDDIGLS